MADYGTGERDIDFDEIERQLREAGGSMYDPSDLEGIRRNISYDEGGVSVDQALANARDNYAERATNTPGEDRSGEHTGVSWWSGGANNPTGGMNGGGNPGGGTGGGMSDAYSSYLSQSSALTSMIQQMQAQQQEDRARQQQERAAMREMLMGRIGQASAPVDVNAPGIKEMLAAQRLSRQRSAERQRSQTAVKMSTEGLGDSGAMDTALAGIEQQRGEGESSDIASVLMQEHQAKRQELLQLYQMAVSMGDAEMARNLQQQIATVDASLQQLSQTGINTRFGQDLDFRQSSFLDNLSLQLLLAQMGANRDAGSMFL